MDSAQDSYKKWGIALIVFLLILIPSEIALIKPLGRPGITPKNKLSTTGNITIATQKKEEGPGLYFLDIVYDPLTNKADKEGSGQTDGHLSPLETEPSKSQDTFSYKIEIKNNDNVISSGWGIRYKDFVTKSDGKYHFRITVEYVAGAKINIYSIQNEKLLEELMQ